MAYDVIVVGSILVDIPVWVARDPMPGETLVVQDSGMFAGGKGLNQACQVARLGGHPLFVGAIGNDILGKFLRKTVLDEMNNDNGLIEIDSSKTSYAVPVISPDNQYILHVSGANHMLTASHVRNQLSMDFSARILMVQGEILPSTSIVAMEYMNKLGGIVVLDPAPMEAINVEMLQNATVLTPNLVEFAQLIGLSPLTDFDLCKGIEILFSKYTKLKLIMVTLGENGVMFAERGQKPVHIPAPKVNAVDPTAAGDAFNGAWAWAVTQGLSWFQSAQVGVHVGALAASHKGALPSLPRYADINLEAIFETQKDSNE
ncbi:ribokinase [Sulfobacillus thermosulfidooxidans DSM 9293]|uniref:Ribokinase n=1 Tax=Sulfobacillus thermosulfidooxidans (strain DSM 9293 / VKM B-1269 / AT-1) TaxID=929705 RepID=A0A1W1WBX0_SULTA|nr:ribokinase [Sulfobacillus thermosulfidooxidans]SMC03786.1 ribokinase [Sulfobacillus thermosulfidooxidans DSM 9293]